jgi:hypothetical protein
LIEHIDGGVQSESVSGASWHARYFGCTRQSDTARGECRLLSGGRRTSRRFKRCVCRVRGCLAGGMLDQRTLTAFEQKVCRSVGSVEQVEIVFVVSRRMLAGVLPVAMQGPLPVRVKSTMLAR